MTAWHICTHNSNLRQKHLIVFLTRCPPCARSSRVVNRLYVPQLSIYNNFIAFMSTLTWVFVYAPALPIALPLSLIKLVFMYWIEKYNGKAS